MYKHGDLLLMLYMLKAVYFSVKYGMVVEFQIMVLNFNPVTLIFLYPLLDPSTLFDESWVD